VFDVPLEELLEEQRSHAKNSELWNNMGSAFGLSNQTVIPLGHC
jgi:hypothetical protein